MRAVSLPRLSVPICWSSALRVVIDCANGAAYKVAPEALWELGAEVIPIGIDPDGFNINRDVGSTAPQALREASRCLDCGVTPVFDGTRCVLCGGCVDVCPTVCLKLVPLDALAPSADIDAAIERTLGTAADRAANSAILKDEDRCIRCALCAMRCPVDAITMERVQFTTNWSGA